MGDESWPTTEPTTQNVPQREHAGTETGDKFRFITFQDPNTIKLKSIQRVIRNHGAKKALEGRKKKVTESTGNFRHFKTDRLQITPAKRHSHDYKAPGDIQQLDPFRSLSISNSTRLQSLITNSTVRDLFGKVQY
jgi:hypothetical protein